MTQLNLYSWRWCSWRCSASRCWRCGCSARGPVRDRLDAVVGRTAPAPAGRTPSLDRSIVKLAGPLAKLSVPEEGWEKSPLRTRFMNAGWRNPSAPALYFAAKTALALLACRCWLFSVLSTSGARHGTQRAAVLAAGVRPPRLLPAQHAAGQPDRAPPARDLRDLSRRARPADGVRRSRPGLDAALVKVAGEIHLKSVVLAQELQLVMLEMRAGFAKEKALRNLALRTGVEDVDTLVAMLIQSERFGTSIGDSLRVHSDNLRTKRRLLAEEPAAKIALKLLFPLIFFIFPSLLVVLMGPAFIQIYRVLLPTMGGGQ